MKVLYFVLIAIFCVVKNIKMKNKRSIIDFENNFQNFSKFAENLFSDKNGKINSIIF